MYRCAVDHAQISVAPHTYATYRTFLANDSFYMHWAYLDIYYTGLRKCRTDKKRTNTRKVREEAQEQGSLLRDVYLRYVVVCRVCKNSFLLHDVGIGHTGEPHCSDFST